MEGKKKIHKLYEMENEKKKKNILKALELDQVIMVDKHEARRLSLGQS